MQANLGMAMMYTLATSAKEWLIGKYGKVEEEEEDEEKKEEVCGVQSPGNLSHLPQCRLFRARPQTRQPYEGLPLQALYCTFVIHCYSLVVWCSCLVDFVLLS